MTTAAILLAAGRSERFGAEDKLLVPFRGAPLVTHAAATLQAVAPDFLVAVTSSAPVAEKLPGFEVVSPDGPGAAQADSLRAGVAVAMRHGAALALVVLGDMPLIGVDLLQDVLDRCTATQASATTDGRRRMPPACFPHAAFQPLLELSGDQGARDLLAALPEDALARAGPEALVDIDTVADLEAYAGR